MANAYPLASPELRVTFTNDPPLIWTKSIVSWFMAAIFLPAYRNIADNKMLLLLLGWQRCFRHHHIRLLSQRIKANLNRLEDFQDDKIKSQQDYATAHTATQSIEVVRSMFPGHLISLCDGDWPTRSSDLTPWHILRGYQKAEIFKDRPRLLVELKATIRGKIIVIQSDLLEIVMTNSFERLIRKHGRRLDDTILKTQMA